MNPKKNNCKSAKADLKYFMWRLVGLLGWKTKQVGLADERSGIEISFAAIGRRN
jgi:hypothetical protein